MSSYKILLFSTLFLAIIQPVHSAVQETNTQIAAKPLSLMEAAQITIKNSPQILIESYKVEVAKAYEQIYRGPFNVNVTAYGSASYNRPAENLLDASANTDSDTRSAGLTVSKLFRTGINSSFITALNSTDLDLGSWADELNPGHTSSLSFKVSIPVYKGWGELAINTVTETSKRLEREASEATLTHDITKLLRDMIYAYWDYNAAEATLREKQNSESRVNSWINGINAAIAKDPNAKKILKDYQSEFKRLEGFLTDKHQKTTKAREAVNTTKNELAKTLGISALEANSLGPSNKKFPLEWNDVLDSFNEGEKAKAWSKTALTNRLDLKALELNHQKKSLEYRAAARNLLPTMSLDLQRTYLSSEYGDNNVAALFETPFNGSGKPNSTVTISLNYPLENDTAQGYKTLANFSMQSSLVNLKNKQRTISIDIDTLTSEVERSLNDVESTLKSVNSYISALQGFQGKIGASEIGASVMFDLLDTEIALVEAADNMTVALNNLAKSIANVRFQTGTLIKAEDKWQKFSLPDMTALP